MYRHNRYKPFSLLFIPRAKRKPFAIVNAISISRRSSLSDRLRRLAFSFPEFLRNAFDVVAAIDVDGLLRWITPSVGFASTNLEENAKLEAFHFGKLRT